MLVMRVCYLQNKLNPLFTEHITRPTLFNFCSFSQELCQALNFNQTYYIGKSIIYNRLYVRLMKLIILKKIRHLYNAFKGLAWNSCLIGNILFKIKYFQSDVYFHIIIMSRMLIEHICHYFDIFHIIVQNYVKILSNIIYKQLESAVKNYVIA